MVRFLFLATLFLSIHLHANDVTFAERQIYPVLEKSTDLHSGLTFLSGALTSVIARTQDDYTRGEWKKSSKISESDANLGDLIGTGAASALIIGGQYIWDSRESNYQSHLRGMIYGGVSIYALKTLFGRNRPGNSNNHQSFPSGHTAISFMTATHLMYAYGWKGALIAYPVATFVGITRLHDDAHWFSDTVAGAFLGYFVGRATYYDSSQPKQQTKIHWMPLIRRDLAGVSFNVSY